MELSRIVLGCDSILFERGGDIAPVMNACEELGINVFDTARGYGKSEKVLGEYIRTHGKREDYFVITKGCLPFPFSRLNPRCLKKDLETSLKTLDIGYIDLYLLHRDDKNADMGAILSILNEYREKGLIREYGVSNWRKDRIEAFNQLAGEKGYAPFKAVSNNFTLLPWVKDPFGGGDGCVSVSGEEEEIAYMIEHNLPLFSYSPLARGFLTGRVDPNNKDSIKKMDHHAQKGYVSEANLKRIALLNDLAKELGINLPSLTIAYLVNYKMKTYPIVGSTSPKRLEENVKASQIKLDEKTMKRLDAILKG